MDKFVVRKPRTEGSSAIGSPKKKKTQMSLRDLKGVVNIDDIKRFKGMLDIPNQTKTNIMHVLGELQKKIPPRQVFQTTQIGRSVKKYRKSTDSDIAELSTKICSDWNKHFLNHQKQQVLEVKCDAKTQKFRDSARKLLSESLNVENSHTIVESIEREIFHQSRKRVSANGGYRRIARTIVFKLKGNEKMKKTILDGTMNIVEFVEQIVKRKIF